MRRTCTLLVALAVSSFAGAQSRAPAKWQPKPQDETTFRTPEQQRALVEATEFAKQRVRGRQNSRAISKVTNQLHWHKRLETATREAQQTNKPILWIQALGDLRGYT